MACDGVELSAYLDGELSGAARQRVEQHAAQCAECRAELRRLERTRVMAIPHSPPASLYDDIQRRVAGYERSRRRRLLSAAAAALLLMAGAGILYAWGTSAPDASPPPIARSPEGVPEGPAQPPSPGVTPGVETPEPQDPEESPATTEPLRLRLVGTVQGSIPQAVIAFDDAEGNRVYRVGDEIRPGLRLAEVRRNSVVVDDRGAARVVRLDGEPAAPAGSPEGVWLARIVNDDGTYDSETIEVRIAEKNGVVEMTGEPEIERLTGRRQGRHIALSSAQTNSETGEPAVEYRAEGNFNADFSELDLAFSTRRPASEDEYTVAVHLKKVSEDEARRRAERAAMLEARREEAETLFKPLERYARDHDRRFPSSLGALVPDYVADLRAYDDRPDCDITYEPGGMLPPTEWPEVSDDLPYPDNLIEWEARRQEVWGAEAPVGRAVLRLAYADPPDEFIGLSVGGIKAYSAEDKARQVPRTGSDSSQNNLKQLGLICKMFAAEHRGYTPPGWLSMYPEYLTDTMILTAPWDEPGTVSYDYLFPAMLERELEEMARLMSPDFDPNKPWSRGVMQSQVPLIAERGWNAGDPGGPLARNVLFLDGHVERLTQQEWNERVAPFLAR